MKILTGAERMFKTLQLQEPDRVPHFELDVKTMSKDIRSKVESHDFSGEWGEIESCENEHSFAAAFLGIKEAGTSSTFKLCLLQ